MQPELEALIRAYDATIEARGQEGIHRREIFQSRVEDALASKPSLSKESLLNAIRFAHKRWINAQKQPPTIPPKA